MRLLILSLLSKNIPIGRQGAIPYGASKKGGSHDHRYNKGADRTIAQKEGDLKRTKNHD